MKIFLFLCYNLLFCHVLVGQLGLEFQNIIDVYIEENNFLAVTASVNMNDLGEWQGASGFSYGSIPMDTALYVGIASNTKLFTSILSLKMIEAGYYTLEDKVGEWLDPIEFVDPQITVRQLLQHNSGVNDFINNTELFPTLILSEPNKVWTPEETLEYIFEPIVSPGQGVYYSNANYLLAAMIMEEATDFTYEELLRDSILTPLGLTDIYLEGFEEIPGEMAHPHLLGGDYFDTPRIALGTTTWAAGCLVSKPKLLTRWYDIVFNSDTFSDFIKTEITGFIDWPDDIEGKDMGLGLYRLNINDRLYYGHGGATIGYSSYTLYDVECGHTISVAINELFSNSLNLAVLLAEKACEIRNMESSVQEELINVIIAPNPANSTIIVEYADYLELVALSGLTIKISNSATMNVFDVPDGIYFLRGEVHNDKFLEKIVIQH